MIQLPKKRPWLILVFLYIVIIAVWTTFIILGNRQGERMTPEEAELHIRKQKEAAAEQPDNTEPQAKP